MFNKGKVENSVTEHDIGNLYIAIVHPVSCVILHQTTSLNVTGRMSILSGCETDGASWAKVLTLSPAGDSDVKSGADRGL